MPLVNWKEFNSIQWKRIFKLPIYLNIVFNRRSKRKTFIAAACQPEKYYSQKPTFLRRGLNGLTVCSFVNRQSWQQPQKRRWNPDGGGILQPPDQTRCCRTHVQLIDVCWFIGFSFGSLMRWQLRRFCISNFAFCILHFAFCIRWCGQGSVRGFQSTWPSLWLLLWLYGYGYAVAQCR